MTYRRGPSCSPASITSLLCAIMCAFHSQTNKQLLPGHPRMQAMSITRWPCTLGTSSWQLDISRPSMPASTSFNSLRQLSLQHAQLRRRRAHNAIIRHALPEDDDEAAPLFDDWRQFRARLVSQQQINSDGDVATQLESNVTQLKIQHPELAQEGPSWAHPLPAGLEKGCVLLATAATSEVLLNDGLEQAVVFVVSHSSEGSMGLLLNRPTSSVLGRKKGGLRFEVANAPPGLQDTFSDARVYCGGWIAQQVIHMMHPYPLPESVQVVQGVYLGGEKAATRLVQCGSLPSHTFKIFSGALVWEPGQLEREVQAGCWHIAACSRSLVLKHGLQLPTPLWREILLLMGGQYAEAAAEAYEGDEVSGD